MYGILESYFTGKISKSLNKGMIRNYNNDLKISNYGLHLNKNNTLKIKNNNILKNFSIYNRTVFNNNYDNDINLNSIEKKYSILKPFNERNEIVGSKTEKIILKNNVNKYQNKCRSIKKGKKETSLEIEKIVSSLINNENGENNNKNIDINLNKYLSFKKNKEKINETFPRENSISPKNYISYNLQNDPLNDKLYKSFNIQIKCINNKAEYRKKILEGIDACNRYRPKIENLKFGSNLRLNKNKLAEELFKNEHNNKFHFNLFKYYNNNILKMKNYNRKKFNEKCLMTFDEKMKSVEKMTKNSIEYSKNLSNTNKIMLKKINEMYN